jgi:anti-sigma factor RsiW
MRNCEQISRALSAWLDHEVQGSDATEIQAHVEQCPACNAEMARLQRLESVLETTLKRQSSVASFDRIWTDLERRIQGRVPWYQRVWDRLGFDFIPARPAWVVSVVAVLLLGAFSVARYFPEWRSNNFAFVESIDAHGSNIALFREAETRTTVIWLFEDLETQDEVAPESATTNSGF